MNDTPLWTGLSLVSALGAFVNGRVPTAVSGVSIDTRTLQPGDLYVAIRGEKHDGHDFVAAAFEKGAAAAVIDDAHLDACRGAGPLYVVQDTLRGLESLGRAARARSQAGIVAVTGSVGKTGTKEMLRIALSGFGETHASAASYNNHWGVPLTLARMPRQAAFGVFEIGMNHAGEITPLVAMVRPQVAIITTVAPVHLENLGSIEAIADAKAEIFSGLEPGGHAIIHRDVAQFERLHRAALASPAGRILTFGENASADATLVSAEAAGAGTLVTANVMGEEIQYMIGAPGRHLAVNSLAVLLAGHALGLAVPAAAERLAGFEAPGGRGRRLVLGDGSNPVVLIDESYNANPTSMGAALELLGETSPGPGGRRIAVLGDMLELGPASAQLHAGLSGAVERAGVDQLFAAGPLMRHLFDAVPAEKRGRWAPASAEIIGPLLETVAPGDVLMVKGSNGSRMAPVVAALAERLGPDTADDRRKD